jgi:hypothetical protein
MISQSIELISSSISHFVAKSYISTGIHKSFHLNKKQSIAPFYDKHLLIKKEL